MLANSRQDSKRRVGANSPFALASRRVGANPPLSQAIAPAEDPVAGCRLETYSAFMNSRLDSIIDAARGSLSEAEQADLADMIEVFLANRGANRRPNPADALSDRQRAELVRRFSAPFEPVPEDEMEAFLDSLVRG